MKYHSSLLILHDATSARTARRVVQRALGLARKVEIVDFSGFAEQPRDRKSVKLLNISNYQSQAVDAVREDIARFEAGQMMPNEVFGNSKVSEVNFAHDYWKYLIQARAVSILIGEKQANPSLGVLFGNPMFAEALRGAYEGKVSFGYVHRFLFLIYSQKIRLIHLLSFGWNLSTGIFAATWLARKARQEELPAKTDYLFLSAFSSFVAGPKGYFDRIMGEPGEDLDVTRLVSLLHKNSDRLASPLEAIRSFKSPIACRRVFFLERWLSIADIFASYFGPLGVSQKVIRRFHKSLGLDFNHRALRSQLRYVDAPKQRLLSRTVARAVDAFPGVSHSVVSVFELVEGRAVVSELRRAGLAVSGLQHGAATEMHYLRQVEGLKLARAINPFSVPSAFIVEGVAVASRLEEELGIPATVIGAMRISLPEEPRMSRPSRPGEVLVLLDMHNWETVLAALVKVAVLSPNIRINIKAHPRKFSAVKSRISHPRVPSNMRFISEVSLPQVVSQLRPSLVLVGQTGASIEIALLGCPMAMIGFGTGFRTNPLDGAFVARSLYVSATAESLAEAISAVPEHGEATVLQEFRIEARKLVTFWGDGAVMEFRKYLENSGI